jgi:hypothetical protein
MRESSLEKNLSTSYPTATTTRTTTESKGGENGQSFAGVHYPRDEEEKSKSIFYSCLQQQQQQQQRGEDKEEKSGGDISAALVGWRSHTRCFGLLFKSWQMELAFLDKQAETYKNAPYVAYALLFVCIWLQALHNVVNYAYFQRWCPVEESDHICTNITVSFSLDSITSDMVAFPSNVLTFVILLKPFCGFALLADFRASAELCE